jgi:hypothetical protein
MKNLDSALKAYYEHFGENYPLCVSGNRSNEEIIADIELCIDTDTEAEQPEYEEDTDY